MHCDAVYRASHHHIIINLYQTTNFLLFQTERFADYNSEIDHNGRKFSKRVESTVGKGPIARYEQFLLFPQCFRRTCTADTKNRRNRVSNPQPPDYEKDAIPTKLAGLITSRLRERCYTY